MEELPGLGVLLRMIEERFGRRYSNFVLAMVAVAVVVFCGHVIWTYALAHFYDFGTSHGWWDTWPTVLLWLLRVVLMAVSLAAIAMCAVVIRESVRILMGRRHRCHGNRHAGHGQ